MIYDNAMVYLDIIICWADSLEEMEQVISKIVVPLDEAELRLNCEKSCFLPKKFEILGHWVEAGLIKPDYEGLNWL